MRKLNLNLNNRSIELTFDNNSFSTENYISETEYKIIDELNNYPFSVVKRLSFILNDLNKITDFKVISLYPFKSNLTNILPVIGSRMENEIKNELNYQTLLIKDQEIRKNIFTYLPK